MKRKRSLLATALVISALMILIPSVLSLLYFYRTVPGEMEAQAESNVTFYARQLEGSITGSMDLTRDIAFSAVSDDTLRRLMQNTDMPFSGNGRNALQSTLGSTVKFQSIWNSHFLGAVYLFRSDGQMASYSPRGAYAQEQRRLHQVYENTEEESSAQTLIRPEDCAAGKLYFIMNYKNIDTLQQLGKLIIEVNADALMDSGDFLTLYPGASLVLSGPEGILYQQGNSEGLTEAALGGKDTAEYVTVSNTDYYHVSSQIDTYQLRLDLFLPTDAINGAGRETAHLYLTFCLLILLLTLLIGIAAYCTLLRPLRELEQTIGRLAQSDYTARLPVSKYRELAQLEETFNRMADNLNASFQDAYQKGIRLQESESRLLAAQINPHFVFNVLETINMRCVKAGRKDISRMVTDLAQLLRGNIGVSSDSQKISFAQELNYVHYYLELQQNRFGEGLSYSVEYEDEELLDCLVPRLTIQPLVENAIVHGLEPRRGLGHVSVRLWEEEDSVYVRIEDNGVGFDPGTLDLSESADDPRHNHIALPNILRRLHLLYGDRAELTIQSTPGVGSVATLILPIDRKEP